MVARGYAVCTLVLGLLTSCNSAFDTYFPQSVEYLETQTSLSSPLGGQAAASVLMGYLPATTAHTNDILVMVAATQDGATHVLFFDPRNLSLKRSYGDTDLKNQFGGTLPNLNLIAQDTYGVYTGAAAYNPQTLDFEAAPSGAYGTLFPVVNPLATRVTFDGNSSVFFGSSNSNLAYQTSPQYVALTSPLLPAPISGASNTTVLDLSYWSGTYSLVVSDSGSRVYLLRSGAVASLVPPAATLSGSGSGSLLGWATSTAAVVQGQANGNISLTAYSWTGSALGTLQLNKSSQQINAITFQPNGASWFLFDSSTGKLSRNRPWW